MKTLIKTVIITIVITLALIILISYFAEYKYNIDLFSVISFGLAIASVLVSGFMGWLSWELYKKSTAASEKSAETASRVEACVNNIQNDIREIVRNVIKSWMGDNPQSEIEAVTIQNMTSQIEETINNKIEELSSADVEAKQKLQVEIAKLFTNQKTELVKIQDSIIETKLESLLPNSKLQSSTASMDVTNNITKINGSGTSNSQEGELVIKLNRPMRIATASGKISADFTDNPSLSVSLIDSPYKDNNDLIVTYGIGQHNDFHVHFKSKTSYMLEPGEYTVSYKLTETVI